VRIVAHVDMDAFYAAVEAQRDPALRDRPLVVGADPKEGHGRGVVTAASYAARRYGIRSALPISRAWRLAEAARRRGEPETIFVRDDHALYREVSARIMAILAVAGDAFQKTSVDEAYLELSSLGSFDAAVERARRLKAEIVSQEGLTASVGIGPNKLVAKIASDFQKPDGLTVVRPEEVQPFLDPLRGSDPRPSISCTSVTSGPSPISGRSSGRSSRSGSAAGAGTSSPRPAVSRRARYRTSGSASPSASRRRSRSTPWTRRSCWSAPARWPARCGAGSRATASVRSGRSR